MHVLVFCFLFNVSQDIQLLFLVCLLFQSLCEASYPADAPGSQDTLFVSVMRFSLCDETLNDVRKDGEETE